MTIIFSILVLWALIAQLRWAREAMPAMLEQAEYDRECLERGETRLQRSNRETRERWAHEDRAYREWYLTIREAHMRAGIKRDESLKRIDRARNDMAVW